MKKEVTHTMKPLTDAQNIEFMNHPERVAAQKRLNKAREHIEGIKTLSAQSILCTMPQALRELSEAYESLLSTEARLEIEIRGHVS